MLWRTVLTVTLVAWTAPCLQALSNNTRRCRPLGDECIAPRAMIERVKLLVGGRRTNRFGKVGGITSFSDIGHRGLTEFYDWPAAVNASFHSPDPPSAKVDEDLLITKFLASSMLRDNIVTVTGYLHHKYSDQLTPILHVALTWIYKSLRYRFVDTTKLLNVLEDMAFQDPETQLLTFFTELEKSVPVILKCSIQVWNNAIRNKEVDLNNIIRPDRGSNIVDLLAGFDMPLLRKVKEIVKFNESTKRNVNPTITELMGPLWAETVAGISDGSVNLTQNLLAMLILHLPVSRFDAEVEEASRFIVDVLRDSNVKSWRNVTDLDAEEKACPIRIVRGVLKRILKSPHVTSTRVKDAVAYLLPEIAYPTAGNIYEFQTVMSPIVVKPKLDVLLLFSYLKLQEFPLDIVDARNRIIEAINTNVLDIYSVLMGFSRFDYFTPEELTIGITNRIRRRYFDLNEDIMDSVKALNSYLVFRKAHAPFSIWAPKGIFDIMLMLEAFVSPAVPKDISKLSKRLLEQITKVDISWNTLLPETSFDGCSTPRHCLVKIFRHLVEKQLLTNEPIRKQIVDFLRKVNYNGEPQEFVIPGSNKSKLPVNEPSGSVLNNTLSSLTNFSDLIQDHRSSLYAYLSRPNILQLLGPSFNASHYRNKYELLHGILVQSLSLEPIQENVLLHENIRVKLAELEAARKSEAKDMSVRENEQNEKQGALPNYPDLIPLLPDLKGGEYGIQKRTLSKFLNRTDLPIILGPEFKPYKFKNKAELLNGVLDAAIKRSEVIKYPSLLTAIVAYKGNINAHGLGDQIITWKAVSRKLDFSMLLTELIDYYKLPDPVADAYDEFVWHIAYDPSVFDDLQFGFNTFVWKTKSDITIGLLKHMMAKGKLPTNIKQAIETLIPFVQTHGPGNEPPEFEDTVTQGRGEKVFQLF